MSIHLFRYDIPEVQVWSVRKSKFYSRPVIKNPSSELWRAGAVRDTLSCWLVQDGRVPPALIRRFDENGVKWFTAPFDPSATESLTQLALESIQREIAERVNQARKSATARMSQLAEVDAPKGSAEAVQSHKEYRTQMGAILRRVKNAIARVRVAATRFDVLEQSNVSAASAQMDALKESMRERARVFAQAHGIIEAKRGKGDAVAKALASGDIYGPIAADYLDEMDDTQASAIAKQLRALEGFDFS